MYTLPAYPMLLTFCHFRVSPHRILATVPWSMRARKMRQMVTVSLGVWRQNTLRFTTLHSRPTTLRLMLSRYRPERMRRMVLATGEMIGELVILITSNRSSMVVLLSPLVSMSGSKVWLACGWTKIMS